MATLEVMMSAIEGDLTMAVVRTGSEDRAVNKAAFEEIVADT